MQRDQVKNILIFRALKLGDMLCSIPALRSLKNNFPNATISLVSTPQMELLFRRYKNYIDEFIPFPGFPGLPEQMVKPQEVVNFITEIQRRKFDLAIQLHGSGELSNPLVTLFDAHRTVGFYLKDHYCPDKKYFIPYPEKKHETHRCFSILEILGIQEKEDHLEFPLYKEDFEDLHLRLKHESVSLQKKTYYCLHPGASTESKRWQVSGFARVADYLVEEGYKVVFTGSAHESKLVQRIRNAMVHEALDTAILNLPLGPLGSLLKDSCGVICNDTGISHLCSALKVPSIVIFSETDPERWAPLNFQIHHALLRPQLNDVILEVEQYFLKREEA